ncbi:MAG TPA: sialidase family protein, partial [Candidatus Thermoplasmatota archaeon]|nr:sialidase family protein [Candidatus Thermoplasmatota archaeon]
LAPGASEWEQVAHAYEGNSDKQWADVDVATGDVYIVTRDLKQGAEHSEELVKTSDGGASWQHVAYFDAIDFAQIAVRPGGHIYLAGLSTGQGPATVIALESHDGGATWGEPVTIAELVLGFTNQPVGTGASTKLYRTPPLPAIAAADGVPRIAVAYFDDAGNGDWDVFVRVSQDGGATWGEPVKVADDASGADQWTPAVALSPRGDVHVTWFDARNDPTLGEGHLVDLYYGHSADGLAFDPSIRVTDDSFLPYLGRHQNQPFFIGDYLGVQASDAGAVMIWPDTRTGESEVFAARVAG